MTQDEALTIIKTGANVFLTGEPGSGKTHTVNTYVAYLNSCGIEPAITASTGIAATHIGGQTIHSWCGIGVRQSLDAYDLDAISGNRRIYNRIAAAKVLVIDEVSMLSASTLAMAEAVCREVRKGQPRAEEPFGGLQVILVGDFFQLPPVSHSGHPRDSHPSPFGSSPQAGEQGDTDSSEEFPTLDLNSGVLSSSAPFQRGEKRTLGASQDLERPSSDAKGVQLRYEGSESSRGRGAGSHFAFAAPIWQKASPLVCYLSEQHRQEDKAFLDFLSAVRKGSVEERHKQLLRTRYAKAPPSGTTTQLYSHNADVDHINTAELSKLSGKPTVFVMESHGPDPLVAMLKKGCLSPETLSLKLGARVMFTKNDLERRFVNGTIGTVASFDKESGFPVIKTIGGKEVLAEPTSWTMQDGTKILAQISQIPLRLAWAITVHKSQGMSLDSAHMNLADAFEYGQGYVALSRVRTLSGLSLAGLNARALEVHPKVKQKDHDFRAASEAARKKFRELSKAELDKMHDNFIKAIGGSPGKVLQSKSFAGKPGSKKETLGVTKSLLLSKLSLPEIAKERAMTLKTIFTHIEELIGKGQISVERDLSHIPKPARFAEIEKAFKTLLSKKSKAELVDSSGLVKLSPVRELLGDSYSFDDLRLARLFLPR